MISTQRIIYCINPNCNNPINFEGDDICASCQTPIVHRYLWASSLSAAKILPSTKIADKYEVIKQRVWLDMQPRLLPDVPEELPQEVIPYLQLYQERLHLPQVYGFARSLGEGIGDILLLENVPIDNRGHIYPTLVEAWEEATAVRQVYWLWQILQLWTPLSELGVAHSLLVPENLRVQGWCVRLLEIIQTSDTKSLQQLGQLWQPWVLSAKTPVAKELQKIVQQISQPELELDVISTQLNKLLLSSVAELPLSIKVAGDTNPGRVMVQNEDNCYPTAFNNLDDPLLPHLAIVCDGIGGHKGGEVASQLAVQSLKLQIRALLAEVGQQTELVPPKLLQEQLEASLRIVNNVISARNNEQKRQGRERMATTLVMAVQVPQRIQTTSGWRSENAHEVYLVNIGDSRAYWITRNYCQLLTVDDDVATREVRYARSLYHQALQRPDANALTQALGTKDAESLRLKVQRFVMEEDGVLLLCSDGLSDNNWVEQSWQNIVIPLLKGQIAADEAVRDWINLANEKNGHDNTSVVLTYYRVSPEYLLSIAPVQPVVEIVEAEPEELQEPEQPEEPISIESSPVLPDLEIREQPVATPKTVTLVKKPIRVKRWVILARVFVLLVGGTSLGLFVWWLIHPQGFEETCQQFPQGVQQVCSPGK